MTTMFNGTLLKELRRRKGISQAELGQACHLSQSAISLWERGRREPDMKALKLFARTFNVPAELFLIRHAKGSYAIATERTLAFAKHAGHPTTRKVKEALKVLDLDPDFLNPLLRYTEYLAREADGAND